MTRIQIVAATAGLYCLFATGSARAAEPSPTAGHYSGAGLIGYGFNDGYKLGIGARGGYTLPANFYVGGTLVYHLGSSQATSFGDFKYHIAYFGAEGGYDLVAGPLIVRPYLGLGYAVLTASLAGFSASSSTLALWPGATALYPMGNLMLGADARFVITGSTTNTDGSSQGFSALGLFATVGYQF